MTLQPEQPPFASFQLVLKLGEVERVGEVAGAEQVHPFDPRPFGESGDLHLLAAGAAVAGVNMQVGDDAHGGG